MTVIYPVVIEKVKSEKYHLVYIPDLEINTEGKSIADAIAMARDAIGIMCIDREDDGLPLPQATAINAVKVAENQLVTLVDADLTEYRKQNETRAVRKNCTIPAWLNLQAEKQGINFSQVLQDALIRDYGFRRQ